MKIATFNVNGINTRLPHLLEWLRARAPDVVCLQELKTPDDDFPGSGAARRRLRRGLARARSRGTASRSWRAATSRSRSGAGCRAIPTTTTAATSRRRCNGLVVACLYLPNGNPQPGPKFDYKLAWFERLIAHAAELLGAGSRW